MAPGMRNQLKFRIFKIQGDTGTRALCQQDRTPDMRRSARKNLIFRNLTGFSSQYRYRISSTGTPVKIRVYSTVCTHVYTAVRVRTPANVCVPSESITHCTVPMTGRKSRMLEPLAFDEYCRFDTSARSTKTTTVWDRLFRLIKKNFSSTGPETCAVLNECHTKFLTKLWAFENRHFVWGIYEARVHRKIQFK